MEQSKFYQIKNITEQEYTLVGCDGSVITRPIQDVDKSASAFTIQDAKDGDVLATSAGAFIYNGNNGGGSCPGSYCGINTLGGFKTGVKHHWTGKKVYPATQEQRDTLIKAMTDAGYEWDAEKKELKKIEYNPAEEYNITGIGSKHAQGKLGEMIKNLKSVNEVLEQKPAWSEEDEERLQSCINILLSKGFMGVTETINTKWLKSLKDRIIPQPKQEWSEEDKETLDRIISNYQYFCKELSLKEGLTEVEKEVINNVDKEDIDWLKYLKDRYTYKPSDEQMEILDMVLSNESMDDNVARILRDIREQLKKLRQE